MYCLRGSISNLKTISPHDLNREKEVSEYFPLGLAIFAVNIIALYLSYFVEIVLRCLERGLPLITYASRGGGGVNTNAYKCVQGGRGV